MKSIILSLSLLFILSCKEESAINEPSQPDNVIDSKGSLLIRPSSPNLDIQSPLEIGDQFPLYEIDYYGNNALDLSAPGEPVLIKFWATWCTLCKRIEDDYDNYVSTLPESIHVVNYSYDYDYNILENYLVSKEKNNVHVYDRKSDGNTLLKNIGLTGIPAVLVISADGEITYKGAYNENFISAALGL